MAEGLRHLDHLLITDRAANRDLNRGGGGNPKIRAVEHRAHGLARRSELLQAFDDGDRRRSDSSVDLDELSALGTTVVLEAGDDAFPLSIDSLDRFSAHRKTAKRPKWLLLSVRRAEDGQPEQAIVWVADDYRAEFLRLFEDYLAKRTRRGDPKRWDTPEGNPANRALIANIGRIRHAVLGDLWTSEGGPPVNGVHWWELWLDTDQPGVDSFDAFVLSRNLRVMPRSLALRGRRILWVESTWDDLQVLPFLRVPLAEIRRPGFVDTLDDLPPSDRDDYVVDLAGRIVAAPVDALAVCHLDSGAFRTHALLRDSLDDADVHTVLGEDGRDENGHGTGMAGLALFGPLGDLLASSEPVVLEHRLESVRMFPRRSEKQYDPLDRGTATSEAVSLSEISHDRRRVFCLTISSDPDRPGEPSLWSATVDALAVGTDVVRDGDQLRLLSAPDPGAARLLVVAAGNVESYQLDHITESDTSGITDPAQAWNALTVSAYTDLSDTPTDPAYAGWTPLAPAGALSPHSRTSTLFAHRQWPIKPDICLEGGNVLTDGGTGFETRHPVVSLCTTGIGSDLAITSANATSAATAQAARLAARAMARYPGYWPETVRALLPHAAEWTPPMLAELKADDSKARRLNILRRYGWGVPTEEAVLRSSERAVTLVTQDEFIPFDGLDHRMRHLRLHSLPWPREQLQEIGEGEVRLRVTLSYFIEPSASRRGWRRRYAYASHGLRFDLQSSLESEDQLVRRINRDAERDEEGASDSTASKRWFVGANQRHLGSLHQDEWTGTGAELAASSALAVYPVGGWWKNNSRSDRVSRPLRYALLVSMSTESEMVDLYTPIAAQIRTAIPLSST